MYAHKEYRRKVIDKKSQLQINLRNPMIAYLLKLSLQRKSHMIDL